MGPMFYRTADAIFPKKLERVPQDTGDKLARLNTAPSLTAASTKRVNSPCQKP